MCVCCACLCVLSVRARLGVCDGLCVGWLAVVVCVCVRELCVFSSG